MNMRAVDCREMKLRLVFAGVYLILYIQMSEQSFQYLHNGAFSVSFRGIVHSEDTKRYGLTVALNRSV